MLLVALTGTGSVSAGLTEFGSAGIMKESENSAFRCGALHFAWFQPITLLLNNGRMQTAENERETGMDGPITPVNTVRTERVQGTGNLPVDPQKLAALRAKLQLPDMPVQAGGELGTDQVIISEMGKALCRFAQTLERDTQMLAAFTSSLPGALREAVLNPSNGRPVNYDAALQLCMALYGPEVMARAATYGSNRERRVDRFDYYRALMEHFGLQYDGDAPDAEEDGRSLWDRFLHRLRSMMPQPDKEEPSLPQEAPPEPEQPSDAGQADVGDRHETGQTQPEPEGLPRLWP